MGSTSDNAVRWAGLKLARRAAKSIPFVGAVVAVVLVRQAVKRKGWVKGLADTALDAIPYVGALKNGLEILVTDDWFPDKPETEQASRRRAGPPVSEGAAPVTDPEPEPATPPTPS